MSSEETALNDKHHVNDNQNRKQNEDQSTSQSTDQSNETTNQSATEINRIEFIRFLLSLTEKMDKTKIELISMTLCYELIKPDGISNLINASIDLDESSQKQTTHNQRFLKLGLIVAGLPKLSCSIEWFFESVCNQLIRILLNTTDERIENQTTTKLINTLIVAICCALYRRSKRLFGQKFLFVLFRSFFQPDNLISDLNSNLDKNDKGLSEFESKELEELFKQNLNKSNDKTNDESSIKLNIIDEPFTCTVDANRESTAPSTKSTNDLKLKIDQTIKISLLLLMNHFEKREILRYFKQFFYLRCVIDDVDCSLNKNLDKLINELLMNVKNSEYLIDKTLFDKQNLDEFGKYKVQLDIERGMKTIVLKSPDEITKIENNEVELKKIDQITQCTVKLICKRSDSFKINTFLLFLQRYSQKQTIDHQTSLLTCSLIDTLMKNIITPDGLIMLINFPEKAIDFVNLTLERLTLNYDNNIYELSTQQESVHKDSDEQLENSIKEDSLNMCLQIIEFVLQKQLFQSLFESLKQTLDNFIKVASNGELNDEIRTKAINLKKDLESKSFISMSKYQEDSVFKQAIQDLNSNLMPDRAHALITLKKLICSKNSNIQSNKAQLITVLKECLQDDESYIYLSAINTLASLALVHTEDVLPILIESFNDKHRSNMDRLKVGQVIVYLSKQLNEMAHCYAKPIMNMLLRASKDECDLIRVSSLSNLAEFCSVLKFKLNIYITEIMICIEYTLKSDPSIEVKRACIMFFHLILNNLDQSSLVSIESELRNIYKLLKNVYNTTLDDLIQLHAQLALEQLNRIAKELLQTLNSLPDSNLEFRLQLK